jgi:hypothetical protein
MLNTWSMLTEVQHHSNVMMVCITDWWWQIFVPTVERVYWSVEFRSFVAASQEIIAVSVLSAVASHIADAGMRLPSRPSQTRACMSSVTQNAIENAGMRRGLLTFRYSGSNGGSDPSGFRCSSRPFRRTCLQHKTAIITIHDLCWKDEMVRSQPTVRIAHPLFQQLTLTWGIQLSVHMPTQFLMLATLSPWLGCLCSWDSPQTVWLRLSDVHSDSTDGHNLVHLDKMFPWCHLQPHSTHPVQPTSCRALIPTSPVNITPSVKCCWQNQLQRKSLPSLQLCSVPRSSGNQLLYYFSQ